MQGQKTLSLPCNVHIFLPYLLNDSQTIRPTMNFSKPLLCLTLICGDGSYWSHFHVIMPVMPDKAAFVSAVLLCVQRYREKCYFTAPKDVEGCFHSLRAVLLHERYFSKIHKRDRLTDELEWCGLLWCFYQLFGNLILTAPIHCRGYIGQQEMQCYISSNLFWWRSKVMYILDALRLSTFSANFHFFTISLGIWSLVHLQCTQTFLCIGVILWRHHLDYTVCIANACCSVSCHIQVLRF